MGQAVVVEANYFGLPIEVNVALSFAAGAATFLALILHILGAEFYVSAVVSPLSTLIQNFVLPPVLTFFIIASLDGGRIRSFATGFVPQAARCSDAPSWASWADS